MEIQTSKSHDASEHSSAELVFPPHTPHASSTDEPPHTPEQSTVSVHDEDSPSPVGNVDSVMFLHANIKKRLKFYLEQDKDFFTKQFDKECYYRIKIQECEKYKNEYMHFLQVEANLELLLYVY